jgi:hypothetical protein
LLGVEVFQEAKSLRRIRIAIEAVPLAVAQKVLAEEKKRKRLADRQKLSKLKLKKSGQM